jgi:hypothetical protein
VHANRSISVQIHTKVGDDVSKNNSDKKDIWQDRAWLELSENFRKNGLPKIMSSSIFLQIYSGDGTDFDVKQAMEMGAMLLLDKPLIIICPAGRKIPTRLARAADYIIEDWDATSTDSQERLSAAIKAVMPD